MKRNITTVFLSILLTVFLCFPFNVDSKGGGGRGGHSSYSSGRSSSSSSHSSHSYSTGHSSHSSGSHSSSVGKTHSYKTPTTKGGHYIGGTGSSHKGAHYSHPKTGNHYPKSGGRISSGSKIKSVKQTKLHSTVHRTSYHGSVKRDSHGKIERSQSAKQDFLRSHGYTKVPKGYQVDHKIPLYAGGSDTPGNMQLLSTAQHKAKTKADYQKYGR